jgi:hypothetical protein
MRSALIFFSLLAFNAAHYAQSSEAEPFRRKGVVLGCAAGISAIHLSATGLSNELQAGLSFPNIKAGMMVTDRLGIVVCLPGSIYRYKGPGRERDRGFEGIVPGVQYWLTDRWWVLGGIGITLDAPAFYDIRQEDERTFYAGPGVLAGSGYELLRKGRFTLELQGRMHYGSARIPEGKRTGMAGNLLIGCNWYLGKK